MRTFIWSMILILCFACGKKPQAMKAVEPTVLYVQASTESLLTYNNSFVGHVRADETVEIKARVEGQLVAQYFEEGRQVKKGDKLFQIEQDKYLASVKQAKAQVAKAEADLKLAKLTLTRMKESYANKAVPKVDVDKAENDEAQATAGLKMAEADLENAELTLKWTEITAPVTGSTGVVSVNVGNVVSPGSESLVTITKDDQMQVEFTINEKDLVAAVLKKVAAGKSKEYGVDFIQVELFLPEGSQYESKGRVAFWDNKINPSTGSLKVRALFDNPKGLLTDGMYVKIRTFIDEKVDSLLIPQAAVLEDQLGQYVLLINDQDLVEKRAITVERAEGDKFVLKSGLTGDEKVILQGLQKVAAGKKVKSSLYQQEK